MSTLSFGFPALHPSHTEEAWFPRLDSDEVFAVNGLERAIRQQQQNIRAHPYPKFVGATAPLEEDDITIDEDDDQEEKSRDAQDVGQDGVVEEEEAAMRLGVGGMPGRPHGGRVRGGDDLGIDEDGSRVISEEDAYTGDDDMDMEGEDRDGDGYEFDIDNFSDSV